MYRRVTLMFVFLLMFSILFSQHDVITKKNTALLDRQPALKCNGNITSGMSKEIPTGIPIGMTNYDLQTNGCSEDRIINHGNTTISVVWTQYHGTTPNTAPQRGSGYNFYNGSSWMYTSFSGNVRVEGSTRTGWPTLMTNGTTEFLVSHGTTGNGLFGYNQTIGASNSAWTNNNITLGPESMLWPRSAYSGNTYYVIAVDNYGTSQTEIDALHFFKSTDAGTNWTYEGEMPNFNSYYHHAEGDCYAIDARNNYVAVVNFADFGDIVLWKSEDYGNTWTETIINDFPVDAYNSAGGVIIDMDENGYADTIMTSDNSGDVIIDSQGKVHVTFSIMKYIDPDGLNNDYSWFPYTDGLYYWNEDMGPGIYTGTSSRTDFVDLAVSPEVRLIGWSPDLNNNGSQDFYDVAPGEWPFGVYYTALSSSSNMGIDQNDNIYIAYSTVMEGDDYVKTDATPNAQQFRHIWVTAYDHQTGYWNAPLCISVNDGTDAECVYPSVANLVDDNLYCFYQWDNEPGIIMKESTDPITNNYMVYKKIAKSEFLSAPLPKIIRQPLNINDLCALIDTSLVLEAENCTAYQWQISTNNGQTYNDIPEGYPFTNTQTDSMSIFLSSEINHTKYRCKVSNANGWISSHTVSVDFDSEAPTITSLHEDQSLEANLNCEAILPDYTGDVVAYDNCPYEFSITQTPLPGTTITGNTNEVLITVSDYAANTSEVTFNVFVIDNTNPVITCPSDQIIDLNDGENVYVVNGNEFDPVSVLDNCYISGIINNYNEQQTLNDFEFPIGLNTIIWTTTDDSGNTGTCNFNLTVNEYIDIPEIENNIEIYPNPVQHYLNVISGNTQIISIKIINQIGETVFQTAKTENISRIDLSNILPGMYLIEVNTKTGKYFRKIVKK